MSSVFNRGYDMQAWLRNCEEEVIEPLEGKLKGTFPNWVQGTLLRNGPGSLKVGSDEYKHVYDGTALLHSTIDTGTWESYIMKRLKMDHSRVLLVGLAPSFGDVWPTLSRIIPKLVGLSRQEAHEGRVTYQCRFLKSETLKKNKAANRIIVTEFGTKSVPDPCHTIFDRMSSFFNPLANLTDNTVISVYPFGDEVYTLTEVTNVYKIDPTTLETLKKENLFNYLIVCHSAHPHVMPNGDVYNIGMMIKRGLVKNVIVKFPYTEKGDMFELAEVVCTMAPRWQFNPTYIHSFGLTENYFVIIEQPMGISLLKILKNNLVNESFASYLTWYDNYETQILLVNRKTKEEIRYFTDTFFFMHTINCFELERKLIIDVCAYKDAKLIDAMYTKAIKSFKNIPTYGEWMACHPKRIEIPLDASNNTHVGLELIADVGIEFPRINYELCNGCAYRYFYGIGFEVNSKYSGSIIKIDTKTGEVKTWHERNGSPSEPVFVARPGSEDEDDGVVLSAVVWGDDDYAVTLLALRASDLSELARAHFKTPSHATKCFHGWFLPDRS